MSNMHIKVLFVSTSLAYGGAETQVVRLASQLKARGWDIKVISLTPPVAYIEELEAANIPTYSLMIQRKLPDPRPIFRLARLIRIWRPDIVHSHMVHANLLARVVRPIAPIPVLINTAHNTNEGGRFRELLYRLTDSLCDLTTQVSRAGLERYVEINAVPRHKIRFIPNGVDADRFRFDPHSRSHIREDLGVQKAFVWLAVGRLSPQKDYPSMLQAFASVAQELPEALLLIVGDGPLRQVLEELARNLGLKDRMRFMGTGCDVPGLMKAADGYLMSSAWEGMPIVLLEASSTGIPIVATDVGGNSEVVLDNETGFLVPPNDPGALAAAMVRIMDRPEVARRIMGEAGRRHIEENYTLDRVTDLWEALYNELLEHN